jgi:hypothetical protein
MSRQCEDKFNKRIIKLNIVDDFFSYLTKENKNHDFCIYNGFTLYPTANFQSEYLTKIFKYWNVIQQLNRDLAFYNKNQYLLLSLNEENFLSYENKHKLEKKVKILENNVLQLSKNNLQLLRNNLRNNQSLQNENFNLSRNNRSLQNECDRLQKEYQDNQSWCERLQKEYHNLSVTNRILEKDNQSWQSEILKLQNIIKELKKDHTRPNNNNNTNSPAVSKTRKKNNNKLSYASENNDNKIIETKNIFEPEFKVSQVEKKWQYLDDNNEWTNYTHDHQSIFEDRIKLKMNQFKIEILQLPPFHNFHYHINLLTCIQTRSDTYKTRQIRLGEQKPQNIFNTKYPSYLWSTFQSLNISKQVDNILRDTQRNYRQLIKMNDYHDYDLDNNNDDNKDNNENLKQKLTVLRSTDKEFKEIEEKFHLTMSRDRYKIINIEANSDYASAQNYLIFRQKQKQLQLKSSSPLPLTRTTEIFAWHGFSNTDLNIILQNGLDMRYNQTAVYGRGNYLSQHASYSANSRYTRMNDVVSVGDSVVREGKLLYVKCLIGNPYIIYKEESFTKPPYGYDSVCPIQFDSSIDFINHVLYDNHQTYIGYVVTFQTFP